MGSDMSEQLELQLQVTRHQEMSMIALDIVFNPSRRQHYSSLVLSLADIVINQLREKLMEPLESKGN